MRCYSRGKVIKINFLYKYFLKIDTRMSLKGNILRIFLSKIIASIKKFVKTSKTKCQSFANILSSIPKKLISLDLNHFGFTLNFFNELQQSTNSLNRVSD
jgi:hypothetical protein